MKFYSEKTNKYYDTEKECLGAEKEYEEKLAVEKAKKEELVATRKARATEIEDAYKAILEARKHYNELMDKFVQDYGSFHMTIRTGDSNPFDRLFDRSNKFLLW